VRVVFACVRGVQCGAPAAGSMSGTMMLMLSGEDEDAGAEEDDDDDEGTGG